MRPSDGGNNDSKGGRILNRYNFQQWKIEIIDYCEFKGKTTQKQMAAFMRSKLSIAHQRRLRTAYDQEEGVRLKLDTEVDANSRDDLLYPQIDCIVKPFDWSIKYLKEHVIRMGDENSAELLEQQHKLEDSLKRLSIKDCQFNLTRYYEKFISVVEQMETIGHVVSDRILAMYFQNGCVPHNDLRQAALDSRRRDGRSYDELYQEFEGMVERAKEFKKSTRGRDKEDENPTRRGTANQTSKFKGKCHHCDKIGHKKDDCWILHPEKKPKGSDKDKEDEDRDNEQQ